MAAKLIRAIPRVCMAVFSLALLTQCSSVEREPRQGSQQQTETADRETTTSDSRSAEAWLTQANAATTTTQQLHFLLQAALTFQQSSQWQQSAAVLSQIETLQNTARQLAPDDLPLLRLAQAGWLAHQRQCQSALEELTPYTQRFKERERRLQALTLIAECYAHTEQFWRATVAQVEAEQYNGAVSAAQSRESIWRYVRQVTRAQLPTTRPSSHSLAGWWRLAQVFHQSQNDMDSLASGLQQWQASYPGHLAFPLVSQLLQQPWQPVDEIIALLPLSGDFAAQGLAVRDGLLMAAATTDIAVRFIDTHTTTLQEQQSRIAESNSLHVVGPLLKNNVDAWKAAPLPGVYHLLLNETTQLSTAVSGTGLLEFALAPEDESRQAARYLARKTTLPPLLLAAENRSSRRLVDAFQQQLRSLTQQTAEVAWYQSKDDMQAAVERSLGIEASKARIREVKIAAGKIIVDEQERSRADLDAIYLPGNLAQIRLLKPFIDVNLSPFSPPLTVYASSEVHQRSNLSGDSDLAGIQFTDSAALIENTQHRVAIGNWLKLRSDASLNQARLVAMGHDSLSLMQRAPAMIHFPGIEVDGLSGTLTLPFGRIQRHLSWAIFSAQGIQPVE